MMFPGERLYVPAIVCSNHFSLTLPKPGLYNPTLYKNEEGIQPYGQPLVFHLGATAVPFTQTVTLSLNQPF